MSFDRKAYMKEYTKKHYQENKDKYKEKAKQWAEENPLRRKVIAKERYAEYRGYKACTCCTREGLQEFYSKCPTGYHVDHVITLSKRGLHCIKNLQYLSPSDHGAKSCKERWEV